MKIKKAELPREKETQILRAAQQRFIAYGYSKVTMDEIAEDIGMAKASLYYYFPTKDDIFRGVIRHEQTDFLQQLQSIDKKLTATEKIRSYFQHRINFSSQIFSLSWHNRQIWPSMKPIFKDLFSNFADEEILLLKKFLRKGKRTKEFSISSPDQMAQLMFHVVQGLRIRLFHVEHDVASYEEIHKALEKETLLFIEIILNGIQTRRINHV